MNSIQLYQRNQIDRTIPFPETWNELEQAELHAIARLLQSDITDLQEVKSILFLEIVKHRCIQKKIPISVIQRLDPEQLAINALPLVDFIFESNTLTKQPYPTLTVETGHGLFLYNKTTGPQDDFENLTAGEFEAAEIYFLQFTRQPDPKLLAQLAAVLYRPKNTPLIKYNAGKDEYITYDYEKAAKHFEKLAPVRLFTIYMWYTGCRNQLPKYFPTLHEGEGSKQLDLMVFTKCIHSAAGPKNGTRDQVRRTLLKALYFEMEQEAIKAKEMERPPRP